MNWLIQASTLFLRSRQGICAVSTGRSCTQRKCLLRQGPEIILKKTQTIKIYILSQVTVRFLPHHFSHIVAYNRKTNFPNNIKTGNIKTSSLMKDFRCTNYSYAHPWHRIFTIFISLTNQYIKQVHPIEDQLSW